MGVRNYHLPRRRDSHAFTGPHEDRESDLVFEILDLFAKRGLGKKESFRGSCNVGCLSYRNNVLQVPELYEI